MSAGYPYPGIIVDPQGVSTSVAVTDDTGATATVYSDRYGVSAVVMPQTITAPTTYYVPGEGPWTVTATVDGTALAAKTVTLADAQVATITVPVLSARNTQLAAYASLGPTANKYTPPDAAGGGAGVSAAVVGVDLPSLIAGQGVALSTASPYNPTITDGGGAAHTLANAYEAVPFTVPAGNTYIGSVLLAITAASASPDTSTYLNATIWSDNSGQPGSNLTAVASTVPNVYAEQLANSGSPISIATGQTPVPLFIRTTGLTPSQQYWLVLQTVGTLSSFKVAQTSGAGVTTKTSADGSSWASGASLSVAFAAYNASQPGGMFHSDGYVGLRGDSGSSLGGTMEGAGGYYGLYGTGGLSGTYGHSDGGYGAQGDSVHNHGVHGASQTADGVFGSSTNGVGVHGQSPGGGVRGDSTSANASPGVLGTNAASNGVGVQGDNTNGGDGVLGRSTAGNSFGVHSEGYLGLTNGWGFTATAGAGLGTTPPALVTTGVNANRGTITFGTGTTPAAGNAVAFAFPGGRSCPTTPAVIVTPINAASSALGLYVTSVSTTGFTVAMSNAPSGSQANTVYGFNFVSVG